MERELQPGRRTAAETELEEPFAVQALSDPCGVGAVSVLLRRIQKDTDQRGTEAVDEHRGRCEKVCTPLQGLDVLVGLLLPHFPLRTPQKLS